MSFKARAKQDKKQNLDGEDLVPIPFDLWSDDSSFIGDAETKAHFEAEVAQFNPREYWDVHEWNFQCIIAQEKARAQRGSTGVKRKRESDDTEGSVNDKKIKTEDRKSSLSSASTLTASPTPETSKEPFNPHEDNDMAYQLTETLDDFFRRLRPNTTTAESGPWIYIANPYAQRRTFDDIGGFKQEGTRALEEYKEPKQHFEDMNPGKPQASSLGSSSRNETSWRARSLVLQNLRTSHAGNGCSFLCLKMSIQSGVW